MDESVADIVSDFELNNRWIIENCNELRKLYNNQ
jgi:hypothetical protein